MGERYTFQSLTRRDAISVVLYRTGIALSAAIISISAYMLFNPLRYGYDLFDALVIALYISVAMSVFFIHLYIGRYKRTLKKLYYICIAALSVLFIIGKGSPFQAIASNTYSVLLLMPLSGCLGFITAKEAFCFKLMEGYALALTMPFYLVLVSSGLLRGKTAAIGLSLIAVMLLFFTLRKVFMPLPYDVGDKSAYMD